MGIFLVNHAALGPGTHAVVETPCYESALQLARSTGAAVTASPRHYADGWTHDLSALTSALREDTCASAPSEILTAIALRHRHRLLERNRAIVDANLPLLTDFFSRRADMFEWVRPIAGPIGFPRVTPGGDVDALCERLANAGVLVLPGSVYDQPDHVRMGFSRANLPEAPAVLDGALEQAPSRSGDDTAGVGDHDLPPAHSG